MLLLLIIILIIGSLFFIRSCIRAKQGGNKSSPVPVVISTARSANVPVYLSALGSVTPTDTVTIRTQVNGALLRVLFREGQMVKANDLLAEIDPRPFEAQLLQFEGQLERDAAQLANARVDLQRYQQLYPQGAVSQQVYATQGALVKQLEGTIKFDQGQIQQVQVNLIYTRIISPINGRVGLRLVDPGNYVQTTNTNGLVVVNEVQPIAVVFALPEDDISSILAAMRTGKPLIVKAYDRTQNALLDTGTLLTIDNQINSTTGTVNLKADFANKNLRLFPNQFVNIDLLVNTLQQATVAPTAAIQHGPQGAFVFLLNPSPNPSVSAKRVTTGITAGDDTVITAGINPGQQVVVEGADQLNDGSAVKIANAASQSQ